jgi:hypothetical protein
VLPPPRCPRPCSRYVAPATRNHDDAGNPKVALAFANPAVVG